jgi:hypothetical protein
MIFRVVSSRLQYALQVAAAGMAARSGPRSVIDATRFTSTTPHATSKHPLPASRSTQPQSETPEQRVRRLRAAHLAAQNARTSKFDRVVGGSRKFFDGAQRVTIWTLVGFTCTSSLSALGRPRNFNWSVKNAAGANPMLISDACSACGPGYNLLRCRYGPVQPEEAA